MPRPGFVLDVDGSTPPILFHHGEGFRLEKLPAGRSRIVYPGEPLEGIDDVDQVVRDPRPLLRGGLGRADVHPPVDEHRVGADHLGVEPLGDLQGDLGLPRGGRPDQGEHGPGARAGHGAVRRATR